MSKTLGNLLIIDPQEDFHPPDGALSVMGAIDDSKRIVSMLDKFDNIYVSLDTHTNTHIGHPEFWNPNNLGGVLKVESDKIYVSSDNFKTQTEITAKDTNLTDYALKYVKRVQEEEAKNGLGKTPMVWPLHCVENTDGHKIHKPLKNALSNKTNAQYYVKGQNELAEMYSIFKSEIQPNDIDAEKTVLYNTTIPTEVSDVGKADIDGKINKPYLVTDINRTSGSLFSELTKDNKDVYFCGEALSHCVNYSLRDFVDNKGDYKGNVYLVLNCSSCVVLPKTETLFFDNIVKLIDYCKNNKVNLCFWSGNNFVKIPGLVGYIQNFFSQKVWNEDKYSKFKTDIEVYIKNPATIPTLSFSAKQRGGRRTRKRSRRRRSHRKKARKTRRSRRRRKH